MPPEKKSEPDWPRMSIADLRLQETKRPHHAEAEIWNEFILKRGWRDASSEDLAAIKQEASFRGRDDIQTWVDYHDADEGRTPRSR